MGISKETSQFYGYLGVTYLEEGSEMKFNGSQPSRRGRNLIGITAALVVMLLFALFGAAGTPVSAAPALQDVPTETPTIIFVTETPVFTATPVNTLPPPAVTGTPTVLVPVTGADLSAPGEGGQAVGLWLALWLVGLALIVFGLYSRLAAKR
jgi:hypothetical protein